MKFAGSGPTHYDTSLVQTMVGWTLIKLHKVLPKGDPHVSEKERDTEQ